MLCILKKITCLCVKSVKITQSVKICYYFNDSKPRRTVLYCSRKTISIKRGITSKNNGDFHYLNCFHSFRTKNKFD